MAKATVFRSLRIARAIVAWGVLTFLLLRYFILPWHSVVSNTQALAWMIAIPTLCIAACSISELALITEAPDLQRIQTNNYTEASFLKRGVSAMLRRLATDQPFTNSMVVMANTILAIGMTVEIGRYLRKTDNADTFTIFGITIILFLLGEMIPKQIALRAKKTSLKLAKIWLYLVCASLIIPFICAGIADSFDAIPGGH